MTRTLAVLVAAGIALAACSKSPEPERVWTDQKVENVVGIVMRLEGQYDLFVLNPTSKIMEEKHLTIMKKNRIFIADVPAGEPAWILLRRSDYKGTKNAIFSAEFHVRSISDLSIGAYMDGKIFVQPQVLK